MPTPPTVTPDYVVIGADGTYASTWGALRCTFGNMAQDYSASTHDVTYNSGFMSSEGNGLIRNDPYVMRVLFYFQPLFTYDGFNFKLENADLYGLIPDDVRDELIGENVTVTAGSGPFAITIDAFTLAIGQSVTVGGGGPIVSIGKLTAF